MNFYVSGSSNSNEEKRTKLYAKLSRDLNENGAAFLKHGETSQSLSLSDMFTIKDGVVIPVPKVLYINKYSFSFGYGTSPKQLAC